MYFQKYVEFLNKKNHPAYFIDLKYKINNKEDFLTLFEYNSLNDF